MFSKRNRERYKEGCYFFYKTHPASQAYSAMKKFSTGEMNLAELADKIDKLSEVSLRDLRNGRSLLGDALDIPFLEKPLAGKKQDPIKTSLIIMTLLLNRASAFNGTAEFLMYNSKISSTALLNAVEVDRANMTSFYKLTQKIIHFLKEYRASKARKRAVSYQEQIVTPSAFFNIVTHMDTDANLLIHYFNELFRSVVHRRITSTQYVNLFRETNPNKQNLNAFQQLLLTGSAQVLNLYLQAWKNVHLNHWVSTREYLDHLLYSTSSKYSPLDLLRRSNDNHKKWLYIATLREALQNKWLTEEEYAEVVSPQRKERTTFFDEKSASLKLKDKPHDTRPALAP